MQTDFFHLLEVEKKPVLRFDDLDPVAYLREQLRKQRESEDSDPTP